MANESQTRGKSDWLSRLLCLAISTVLGFGALALRDTSAPSILFWLVVGASLLFAFAGVLGPKGLRHGLLAGFPGSG